MSLVLIKRYTLTGPQASVVFDAIPQNYKSLKLLISSRLSTANINDTILVYPNGLSTNGSSRNLLGDGANTGSGSASAMWIRDTTGNNATASTFGSTTLEIPNYSGYAYKAMAADSVTENNATTAVQGLNAILWSNTSPINSLTLTLGSGSFLTNSTFSLYGTK